KNFAATGLRVGWCMGPAHVLSKMKAILSHVGAWAPMAEQVGVTHFLKDAGEVQVFLLSFKHKLYERLELLYKGFMSMKSKGLPVDAIAPKAGIYLTLKIDVPDAHKLLLEQAGVGVLPMEVFGAAKGTPWYRISVGTCKLESIAPMLDK